eukprot:SAG31_NODE_7178_length_1764_cov_4.115405_1_plen_137_part_00
MERRRGAGALQRQSSAIEQPLHARSHGGDVGFAEEVAHHDPALLFILAAKRLQVPSGHLRPHARREALHRGRRGGPCAVALGLAPLLELLAGACLFRVLNVYINLVGDLNLSILFARVIPYFSSTIVLNYLYIVNK